MFGKDKNIRMKALAASMSDKPAYPGKRPMEMEESMEAEGGPDKSYTAFPVTEEEKEMILAMRKEKNGGMEEDIEAEEMT